MRSVLLLAASSLIACGPGPSDTACQVPGFASFRSESPVYCNRVAQNFKTAHDALASLIPADAFPRAFAEVAVTRRAAGEWSFGSETVQGLWHGTAPPLIEVGEDMGALAHEMLHQWEAANGRDSAAHVGWDTNGYWFASRASEFSMVDPTTPCDVAPFCSWH